MEIPRDPNPVDPVARRRAAEGVKRSGGKSQADAAAASSDAVSIPASETVTRYVEMLKAHAGNPAKLESLRRALEDGTFTATPEELVDPLLDRLDESGG